MQFTDEERQIAYNETVEDLSGMLRNIGSPHRPDDPAYCLNAVGYALHQRDAVALTDALDDWSERAVARRKDVTMVSLSAVRAMVRRLGVDTPVTPIQQQAIDLLARNYPCHEYMHLRATESDASADAVQVRLHMQHALDIATYPAGTTLKGGYLPPATLKRLNTRLMQLAETYDEDLALGRYITESALLQSALQPAERQFIERTLKQFFKLMHRPMPQLPASFTPMPPAPSQALTPQQAYEQAWLHMMPDLMAATNPHDHKIALAPLASVAGKLPASPDALAKELAKQEGRLREFPNSDMTRLAVKGLRIMAQLLEQKADGVPATNHTIHPQDIICDMSALYEAIAQNKTRYSHSWFDLDLESKEAELDIDESQAWKLIGGHIGILRDTVHTLEYYHPGFQNPVDYFDQALDRAIAATRIEYAEAGGTRFEVLDEPIALFRAHIKHDLMGVVDPARVRRAIHHAIQTVTQAGEHDAVSIKLAATYLRELADGFRERHDLQRYFTESSLYQSTQSETRESANAILRAFFTRLEKPIPELPLHSTPSALSPEQIDSAYASALRCIAPNLAKIVHTHNTHYIKERIGNAHAAVKERGPGALLDHLANAYYDLEHCRQKQREGIEYTSEVEEILLAGLNNMAESLGVPMNQTALHQAIAAIAMAHTITLQQRGRQFDLTCDMLALRDRQNTSTTTRFSTRDFHAYITQRPKLFAHIDPDAPDARQHRQDRQFGLLKYYGELQGYVVRRLESFHPEVHDPVSFLNAQFAAAKTHMLEYAEIHGVTHDIPMIEAHANQWMAAIKEEIGAVDPARVRAAMQTAIDEVITPAARGRTIGRGERVDARLAKNLALSFTARAIDFQERHDVMRFFHESEHYTKTRSGIRRLANQTLERFFMELDLPAPELSPGAARVATR